MEGNMQTALYPQEELFGLNMIDTCCRWLAADPLFLDTETTGLDDKAEVVELAVVNADGKILVDTLIKPVNPIPREATALHGITNEMVKTAPCWQDIYPEISAFITGRLVLAYNAPFDARMLEQTCGLYRLPALSVDWQCIMRMYKDHTHNYKYVTLSQAAAECRVAIPGEIHRALADTWLCLGIVRYIGAEWNA
jgi:DNA polymerase III subunit epsilon